MVFSEVVDAADHLSPEEQIALVEILQHRLTEYRRQVLQQEVMKSRQAFQAGETQPASVQEIMDEIQP